MPVRGATAQAAAIRGSSGGGTFANTMTIQVDTGPTNTASFVGDAVAYSLNRASTRYRVQVSSPSTGLAWNHCYGFGKAGTITARSPARYEEGTWAEDDSVELSWSGVGSDESVTFIVRPANAAATITAFTVYPKHLQLSAQIVDIGLSLVLPQDTRVYVEITLSTDAGPNRKDTIALWNEPLAAAIPSGTVVPITAGSPFPFIPAGTALNPTVLVFGRGIHFLPDTANTPTYSSPTATLITREKNSMLWKVQPYTRIYLQRGAWVVGSFDFRDSDNIRILGPGTISGEWATWDDIGAKYNDLLAGASVIQGTQNQYINPGEFLTFEQQLYFTMFMGSDPILGGTLKSNMVLQDVVVAGSPFISSIGAWGTIRRQKFFQHWYLNADAGSGLVPDAATGKLIVDRCLWLVGDDGISPTPGGQTQIEYTNCHCIAWGGSPINLGYWGSLKPTTGYGLVQNCVVQHNGTGPQEAASPYGADLYSGTTPASWSSSESQWQQYGAYATPVSFNNVIIKSLMDNRPTSGDDAGHYNITIDGLRVEGSVPQGLFSFFNAYYPFALVTSGNSTGSAVASNQFEKKGNMANIVLRNITVEQLPTYRSRMVGKDKFNAPHDITFENVTIAGNLLTSANWDQYVLQDWSPYNILVEGRFVVTSVDICNAALSHIGESSVVVSLSPPDGSAQSSLCLQFFNRCVEELLEMHQWSFATKRVSLTPSAQNEVSGWGYSYDYPPAVAQAIQVLPEGEKDTYRDASNNAQPAYTIEQNAAGDLVLYCDLDDAELRYVKFVYSPGLYPPLFISALEWLLASKLAGPIMKGDVGAAEAKRCLQMVQFYIGKAAVSDSNQRNTQVASTYQATWINQR